MLRDHLVSDRSISDEHLALGGEGRIPFSRHLRRYRVCVLLVLALFGLHLLAARSGASNSLAVTPQQAAHAHASIQAVLDFPLAPLDMREDAEHTLFLCRGTLMAQVHPACVPSS